MSLDLTPLSELLGVEVSAIDCRFLPDEALQADILTALYEHQVLVFRDQKLHQTS